MLHLRVLHGQLILDIDGKHPALSRFLIALYYRLCLRELHAAALLSTAFAAGLVLDSPKLRQLVVTAGILAISCSPDEAEDQVRAAVCLITIQPGCAAPACAVFMHSCLLQACLDQCCLWHSAL